MLELRKALENSIVPFILGKSEQFNDNLMPVHIAASLQYSFDTKDSRNGFGYGEFAKLRLKQYLNSLKNFGINRILENKSMTYKEDFIKYHLIPGIYCADHIFVHDVMSEFHQLRFEKQSYIIHWKEGDENQQSQNNFQAFGKKPLYWATRQNQQSILSDVVRAEFNAHNSR